MVSLLSPSPFPLFLSFQSMITLMFLLNLAYTKPLCHNEDRIALVQFNKTFLIKEYASSDPLAYPKVASWINHDCCLWDGVQCDKDTGHVVGLDVSSSYLYGSIDSWGSLFQLVHLRSLNVADNYFNFSHIPYEVSYFSQLTLLNLSSSAFYGLIPSEITRLSTLTTLDLGHNLLQLRKSDFGWLLANMTSLEKLVLKDVSILSNLPTFLANLTSLTYLDLSNCNLFGSIPASLFLGNLTKLNFLSFRGNNFSGSIPSSLGELVEVMHLDLSYNSFSGKIPSSMANLTQLEYLNLHENNFTPGDLSWISKQAKLLVLGLSAINIDGKIPSSIYNLTHLQTLLLSGNNLIGELPPEISDLTKLVVLDLGFNQMHGPIPNSISKLVNLEVLFLGPNLFTGTVKFDIFFNLTYLNVLQLSGDNLTLIIETNNNATLVPKFHQLALMECNLSEFPQFLRYQDELEYLDLEGNKLQGHIPNWIGNLSKKTLTFLDLRNNSLTSFEQSSAFSSLTSLGFLDLSYNELQGSIPSLPISILEFSARYNLLMGHIPQSICNLNSLHFLDLSYNKLDGSIPPCLGNLNDSLIGLSLRNNFFRGNIPSRLANLTNLRSIDLSNNQLCGPLPASLANWKMLMAIDLSKNLIGGRFPLWLADLPNLEVLILRSNHLSGEIGAFETLSGFPNLRILDLSYNDFTGVLPNEFFKSLSGMKSDNVEHLDYLLVHYDAEQHDYSLASYVNGFTIVLANKGNEVEYWMIPNIMAAIDLSSNRFQGEIPTSIGSLKMVNVLNLSNNHLSGAIPSILSNLSRLESLDLSRNVLSGEIPSQLNQLTFLSLFNVSHNQLEGPIPRGNQFYTFENSSYVGNLGLCGKPLTKTCDNHDALLLPPPAFEDCESCDKSVEGKIVIIGYVCGIVVGLVFGFRITTTKHEWFMKTLKIRQDQSRRRIPIRREAGTV